MSQTPAAMGPEEAQALIIETVYAPHFFQKLAGHGIAPRDEGDAQRMMRMAAKLVAAEDQEKLEKSAAQVDYLEAAERDLDAVLGQYGYAAAEGAYEKQAAEAAAAHPSLRQAAEVLLAASAAG